jgi:hypothetical protein
MGTNFKNLCETFRSAQAEMFAAEAACDWKALRAAEKRVLHLRHLVDLERNKSSSQFFY